MTRLPDDELKAIAERASKATEGPWCWESVGEKSNEFTVGSGWRNGEPLQGRVNGNIDDDGEWVEDTIIARHFIGANESGHANFADADFIAHARTDIPALLAEVAALNEELTEAVRIANSHAQEMGHMEAEHKAQLDAANARVGELADLLQRLMDVQNGAPLVKYEADWQAVMDAAAAALAGRNEKRPPLPPISAA